MNSPLQQFVKLHRARLTVAGTAVRIVHQSDVVRTAGSQTLDPYIAQRALIFYRSITNIIMDLQQGYPLNTFKETLARIPQSESFRTSHFGEIAACLFAEEVVGLKRLYSKLSLLTAENANANKMDLLLYDPGKVPLEFVLGEVKCSAKSISDGDPPRHHESCFASLFKSMREYTTTDLEFDLAAIKDRLNDSDIPQGDKARIIDALRPYSQRRVRYAGFVVIDASTRRDDEAQVLATRASDKEWDVDLVGFESYSAISESVYKRLEGVLEALRRACSP
ncbi:Hachiman antiphage defense system protein HamA [Sorangium sp. So ce887]|uniref:Hachiman antiphage defense system protein HamA n=1 Tax=Sorangium sp. So ce887 TaxID=3133324 RepID=UPI003F60F288